VEGAENALPKPPHLDTLCGLSTSTRRTKPAMKLRDLFTPESIQLDMRAESKDEALRELIKGLALEQKAEDQLFKTLKRRENLGSTGIGKAIAIPHCRSLVVNRLRLAYGRKPAGLDFKAIDSAPVVHLFLIVAPPLEVSNQYLPVLGKIAQFAKDPDVPTALRDIADPEAFLELLEHKAK